MRYNPRFATSPPAGWYVFGHHVDQNVKLEFWGNEFAEDGLPIWERPIGKVNSTWTPPPTPPPLRRIGW